MVREVERFRPELQLVPLADAVVVGKAGQRIGRQLGAILTLQRPASYDLDACFACLERAVGDAAALDSRFRACRLEADRLADGFDA